MKTKIIKIKWISKNTVFGVIQLFFLKQDGENLFVVNIPIPLLFVT